MKYCLATTFALLLAVSAAAQVPEPKLQPTSATQAQKDIIKEGSDLHDKKLTPGRGVNLRTTQG